MPPDARFSRFPENVTQSLLFRDRVTTLEAYPLFWGAWHSPPCEDSSAMILDSEPGERNGAQEVAPRKWFGYTPQMSTGSGWPGGRRPDCENTSAGAYVNLETKTGRRHYVAYFESDLPQSRGHRHYGRRDSYGYCSARPGAGYRGAGGPSAGGPSAGDPGTRGPTREEGQRPGRIRPIQPDPERSDRKS